MNIVEKTIGREHRGVLALAARICLCGQRKDMGMSFCGRCYHRLRQDMKDALYRRAGQGYEEAYDAAVEYLSKK